MASYTQDECPVCGSVEYRLIGAVKEKAPPVPVPPDSAIVKCGNCRAVYINPMPFWSAEDFSKLYDDTYFTHLYADKNKHWLDVRENRNPEMRYELIRPRLKTDVRNMLEIGAGEFAFMCRYLKNRGWAVTAQEPSAAYREKLRVEAGIEVESGSVTELSGNNIYSLIYADSVLEHVANPVEYYARLADLLVPGGVLYTISPNEYSTYNFVLNLRSKMTGGSPNYVSPYQPPYHLIGYTKKSLEILADKSGLELVSYKRFNDYMAHNMIRSNRNPLIKYPAGLVYALSDKFGFGTNGEALFVKK